MVVSKGQRRRPITVGAAFRVSDAVWPVWTASGLTGLLFRVCRAETSCDVDGCTEVLCSALHPLREAQQQESKRRREGEEVRGTNAIAVQNANNFDTANIKRQVQYLGLLENIRVRRAGYAFRSPYERFINRCVAQDLAAVALQC